MPEELQPGILNYGGPQANPGNKEGKLAFIGKRRDLGGPVITKGPLEEAGSPKYGGFSLVGLLQSRIGWAVLQGEKFSSSCWIAQ